jgi:protein TonB
VSSRPSSRPSAGEAKAAARRYLRRLRRLLERSKRYPALARRNGIQGRVRLSFVILPDGTITSIRIVRSSGTPLLDRAARAALGRVSGRLKPPQALRGRRIRSSVRLVFRLP